jgi:trimeric autotransporter adhesin
VSDIEEELEMVAIRMLVGISGIALAASALSAQNNTSVYNQTGAGNSGTVDNTAPGNTNNSSIIIQNGANNSASVFQRNNANASFIEQLGSFQTATHQQVGTFNRSDSRQSGDFQITATTQAGTFNSQTLLQVGANNRSIVRQGYAVDASVPGGEIRAADFNTASVEQNGAGLNSVIDQRAASASSPAASDNEVYILQRSSGSSSSVQQTSTVLQESRGNFARISQFDGAVGAANSSSVTQRNTASPQAMALNSATIEQRGVGHESRVTQDGSSNSASVQMAGGGVANDGNRSAISQVGTSLTSAYANVRVVSGRGVRNQSSMSQSGAFHTIQVYQAGIGDASSITQSDGANTGTYQDGTRARAVAFVSQNATSAAASLTQRGDNYGEVVQARGGTIVTTIVQTDAGDLNGTRAFNSATVSQYGSSNAATIEQNSIGALASVWQQVGSTGNEGEIRQGAGGTSLASTTTVPGFNAGPTGAATGGLRADLIQAGSGNQAKIYQDGVSLRASVEQRGSSSGGGASSVLVSQSGSGNVAAAYQGSSVGPSAAGDPASGHSAAENAADGGPAIADEFYFSGGSRSAELVILQTNTNNSGDIRQFGRGQLARIEQSGSSNTGSIRQESGATNATAILRQIGSNNSYYIVQTTPGQYVVVTQTGTSNSATNVTRRGADGGSIGFTPPPGG